MSDDRILLNTERRSNKGEVAANINDREKEEQAVKEE